MSIPNKCPVCGAKKLYEHHDRSVSFSCGGNLPHTPCPGAVRSAIERGEKIEELEQVVVDDEAFALGLIASVCLPDTQQFDSATRPPKFGEPRWRTVMRNAARKIVHERAILREPHGAHALAAYDALKARVDELEKAVTAVWKWSGGNMDFQWPERLRIMLYKVQPQEKP